MEEGIEVSEVMDEMSHEFVSETDGADVVLTEVEDYEVTDSNDL
jgi:hypothetical protein